MAVRGGRITAIGPRPEIAATAGPETVVNDHGDHVIVPGFRDAHVHLVPTGLAERRLDLRGLTLAEIQAAVAARAAALPPGAWIEGRGFHLAHLGGRPPAAGDLDDAAPDHPVRLASHDLHALAVNRRALAAAGRPADSPSYLVEDEVRAFLDAAGRESPADLLAAARAGQDRLLAAGITEVQDHGRLDELAALSGLAAAGALRLRVHFSVRDHELADFIARRGEFGEVPGRLEVNGMKIFLDGALGSRTAWTLAPYRNGGLGRRTRSREEARAAVAAAARAGLPTFFHAIGDAAVREALDLAEAFPGLLHRVEHAELIDPADVPRFARLGVVASVQPGHLLTDAPVILDEWGPDRARQAFPLRSLLDAGAEVRFGSDAPVETCDPGPGLFAACERRPPAGPPLPGDEAIERATALALHRARPELRPGDPADLAVFPADPAAGPATALPALRAAAAYPA